MEYVGYGMIAVLFIGLFIMAAKDIGYKGACGIFTIVSGLLVWVSLAAYLIGG